jgi:sodium transport system permease protein
MKWPNIKLIYLREIRDQLRDRRTLFTVAIMPMLLYPLMGMALLQVGQFMKQTPTRIWLINAKNLPDQPSLLIDGRINPDLLDGKQKPAIEFVYSDDDDQRFLRIIEQYRTLENLDQGEALAKQLLQQELARMRIDAAIMLIEKLPGVGLAELPAQFERPSDSLPSEPVHSAQAFLFLNSASDRSTSAANQVAKLLQNWEIKRTKQILGHYKLPDSMIDGVSLVPTDLADSQDVKAVLWAKILPFIVVIWALTGAFYPAIDLCAGEKERGTFETLLSCPAARSEIALGKLLTVMSFSYATSLLNLISMSVTGFFVATKLGSAAGGLGAVIGLPPLSSFFWLMIALVPISALFSAIALAAAAFARSTKEGQYYLVPIIMVSMPLMIVPSLPSAQLDLGTSLIPISGLIMLLRGLIEGHYAAVAPFFGPVCIVTFACCWFAIKWVIAQFNSESVLFRPSEQFSVQIWFKSLLRERENMPTLGNAVLCAVAILLCKFFIGFASFVPQGFGDFAVQVLVTLMAAVAAPAIIMALILSRSPRQALRLNRCSVPVACAAILTAIFLNPLFVWLSSMVIKIYPPTENLQALESMAAQIFANSPGIWATLLVLAVAPAIFEEIGFRGFILSGMESLKTKWHAILITSFLFGITHSVIHQTVVTFFVGIALGIIAVQTRSLIPCILFHATHNAMAILMSHLNSDVVGQSVMFSRLMTSKDGISHYFDTPYAIVMGIAGLALLVWFWQLPKLSGTTVKSSLNEARIVSAQG